MTHTFPCTKCMTPAVRRAGWDEQTQQREEVTFTKGRVIVRGKLVTRGKANRADYLLYYKPNIPLAVIEAKDNHCAVGDGIQQALEYAKTLSRRISQAEEVCRQAPTCAAHRRRAKPKLAEARVRVDSGPRDPWRTDQRWRSDCARRTPPRVS